MTTPVSTATSTTTDATASVLAGWRLERAEAKLALPSSTALMVDAARGGVVVLECQVVDLVDISCVVFALEVVERTEQEVALLLERRQCIGVEGTCPGTGAHGPPPSGSSRPAGE